MNSHTHSLTHSHIDEDITHATVTVDGNYNNSIPYHQTYDLCDLVKDVDKSCPIKKGVLTFKLDIDLPSEAPAVSKCEMYCCGCKSIRTASAMCCPHSFC